MSRVLIPPQRVALTDASGYITAPWFQFLSQFSQGASDELGRVAALADTLAGTVGELGTQVGTVTVELGDVLMEMDMTPDPTSRVAELEQRVRDLETELAELTETDPTQPRRPSSL